MRPAVGAKQNKMPIESRRQKKKWSSSFGTILRWRNGKRMTGRRSLSNRQYANADNLHIIWQTEMNADEQRRLRDAVQQAEVFERCEELDRMRQPLTGQLMKFTNALQGWQQRTCVLDPEIGELRYYLKSDLNSAKPRGVLNLAGAEVVPSEDDSVAFIVIPRGSDAYRFKATSTKLRQEWINRLRTVANFHTPSKRRTAGHDAILQIPDCPESIYRGTSNLPAVVSTLEKTLTVATEQLAQLTAKVDSLPANLRNMPTIHHGFLSIKSYAKSLLDGLKECNSMLSGLEDYRLLPVQTRAVSSDLSAPVKQTTVSVQTGMTEPIPLERFDPTDEVLDEARPAESDFTMTNGEKKKILSLLSRLKLGCDLTNICLPVFIVQHCSFLETCSDFFTNLRLFLDIGRCHSAQDRLVAVLKWYLLSFHSGCKNGIARKPLNPVLGEVFRCTWCLPDNMDSAGVPSNVQFCAEQISHHPPVTCFYAATSDGSVRLNGNVSVKSKFMGMSVSTSIAGDTRLFVARPETNATKTERGDVREVFQFQFPTYHARSILTTPWIELGGKVQISSLNNDNVAIITFETKSFYGSKSHWVTAEVKTASGVVYCRASGDWRRSIDFSYANGTTESLQPSAFATGVRRIRPVDKQQLMESRRIWKDVIDALINNDFDTAQKCKESVESIQRTIDYNGMRHFVKLNDTVFAHVDLPAEYYDEP